MRIPAQELKATFQEILLGRGVDPVIAEAAAQNALRNREDKWVVSDLCFLAAPCRGIGHRVSPADSHTAPVRSLPPIGAAPHPVPKSKRPSVF